MSDLRRREFRGAALAAVVLLSLSYLSVLYHVTDVVGDTTTLLALVAGTLALATLVGLGERHVPAWAAVVIALLLVAAGMAAYFNSVPESQRSLLTAERLVNDAVALLTGLSVLRLTEAGTWALAVAPGPLFLSWYLAVRRRYAASAAVGSAALGLFVLTGDAGVFTTLAGAVGATGAVAFGSLERRGGTVAQLESLVVVLAAIIVLVSTVSVLPGSAAAPLASGGSSSSSTVEASLVNTQDSVAVLGSISLSPRVRFMVRSEEGRYWQTGAYDRYTGDGWVRTGNSEPYTGELSGPPGDSRALSQEVTAQTPLRSVPAAWKPVALEGSAAATAQQTPQGTLQTSESIRTGESFTVTSRVPEYTEGDLQRAGTDYPDEIERGYLQLPDSTTDRVRERSANVTADAENPYEKAVAVENYLESEKEYSLTVQRPPGNTADSFLFEMERGYCVYYATTMVTMLRSEGVPARFAVGYTSGQRGEDGQYVVRGLDSHAWVQVYFPGTGWVNFDPTPAEPRERAEAARLEEFESSERSDPGGPDAVSNETPTRTPTANETTTSNNGTATVTPGTGGQDGGGVELPSLPPLRTLAVWAVAFVGAVAGARRSGATGRAYRTLWRYYQGPRGDPDADVERAFARLQAHLGRRYREPWTGETPREYVESLRRFGADERVHDVLQAYERARYGEGVSPETADDVVETVDAMVRSSLPLVGRLYGPRG